MNTGLKKKKKKKKKEGGGETISTESKASWLIQWVSWILIEDSDNPPYKIYLSTIFHGISIDDCYLEIKLAKYTKLK